MSWRTVQGDLFIITSREKSNLVHFQFDCWKVGVGVGGGSNLRFDDLPDIIFHTTDLILWLSINTTFFTNFSLSHYSSLHPSPCSGCHDIHCIVRDIRITMQ